MSPSLPRFSRTLKSKSYKGEPSSSPIFRSRGQAPAPHGPQVLEDHHSVLTTPFPTFATSPSCRHNRYMTIAAILGPSGAIAQRLKNYEARPEQLAMAE